jgi:putative ATP-dependent endonuclease of the OLD family
MKIKSLTINGFRCLQCLTISFEEDITVVVGENDSGKTSLIDCLKVITQNRPIELDDFSNGCDKIVLSIEIENFVFNKIYQREGNHLSELPLEAKPTKSYLREIKEYLESADFDIALPENIEKIRAIAKLFGLTVRSNSNNDNLRNGIIDIISKNLDNDDFRIDQAQFPRFNNIQLDGKQFENVSAFFKEVFLKEKQGSIWQERVESGVTIEEFIRDRIESYSEEISSKMNETGIKDKIRLFLKDLTDIRIEPIYQTRDLNIDAKVKFLENGTEINLQKKGDGTKRRITMALLEFKKEQERLKDDSSTIYLLDEPDTHLHVRAQIDLLQTLQAFASAGDQVILTTHSPFLINSVKPDQIRLLSLGEQNCSQIKYLHDDPALSAKVLQSVGVENVYLFFARTIVIVEGETEEQFISHYFLKTLNRTINADLIKIINVNGVQNIYGFAKGILELHSLAGICAVFDNDLSDELRELIERLGIHPNNRFVIGNKEFEDAFTDEVLFDCWKQYHEAAGRTCPESWTVDNIRQIREKCESDNSLKFSKEIRQLNSKGMRMTKPILGSVLAQYVERTALPSRLNDLFRSLTN